jgi:hypothetical protein
MKLNKTPKGFRLLVLTGLVGILFLSLLQGAEGRQSGGQNRKVSTDYQSPGSKAMAERLAEISKGVNIARHMPNVDLEPYFRAVKQPLDAKGRIILEVKQAYGLLTDGKNEEAVQSFKQVKDAVLANKELFDANFAKIIRELLAVSYLRLGETENLADNCLLLVSQPANAINKNAFNAATKEYAELLNEYPDDLTARWLLNVAYMKAGDYPKGVPKKWLIAPEAFKSDYDLKTFKDIAPQLGLDVMRRAGGVILEDFDGDGYIDIMVSSVGLDKERNQLLYFHNDANGGFSNRTAEAGLTGITGGLNIVSSDYNNDGFIDVLIPRGAWLGPAGHHPASLLRNNGNGTFDDVAEPAGLNSCYPSHTVSWADYDNDGYLDLFVGNESLTFMKEINPLQLFHNNGNGTFTDIAAKAGISEVGWVKGATWGDYNNDGRPDLYISRLFETNLLYRNDGKDSSGQWKFTEVSEKAGVREPKESYSTFFFDYDNDGWLDLFVTSVSAQDFSHLAGQVAADYLGLGFNIETPRLYKNNRDGSFTDVTREAKLRKPLVCMASNFGDLDNDSWLDIYVGTGNYDYRALMPNRMLRNAEGKFFQDVTTAGGFGHLQKGHAIAFGDLDNDGYQEIFNVLGGVYVGDGHPAVLFSNPGHGNHWISLRLEGVNSNRAAIGARIKVRANTRSGIRDIYASVSTGGSFGSSTLQQVIGLAKATSIHSIEITWPTTGKTQVLKNIAMDQIVKIREDSANAVPLKLRRLKFDGNAKARMVARSN